MSFLEWLYDRKTLSAVALILATAPAAFQAMKTGGATQQSIFAEGQSCAVISSLLAVVAVDLMVLAGIEQDHSMTMKALFAYILVNYLFLGILRTARALQQTDDWRYVMIQRENAVEANNIYQDLSAPVARVILVFAAQSMLMAYYLEGLTAPVDLGDSNVRAYWASSIPIQLMASSQMGLNFVDELPFWSYLFQNEHPRLRASRGRATTEFDYPVKVELGLRCFLSLIANSIYFYTITFTLPVQLMSSETSLDFVKDTFAIAFIVCLDDLSEPRVLSMVCGDAAEPTREFSSEEQGSLP